MPGFDKTGPQGFGERTGRGLGNCGERTGRGLGNCVGGMRQGFGCRAGRCGFYGMAGQVNQQDEQKILESDLVDLENEKRVISERIEILKKG